MIWLTSLIAAAGVAACVFALLPPSRSPADADPIADRMAFYGMAEMAPDEELSRLSFYERIIQPPLNRIALAISRRTPLGYREQVERRLALAGYPYGLGFASLLVVRALLGSVALGLGVAIGIFNGSALVGAGTALLLVAGSWLGVGLWLRNEIRTRAAMMQRALPDVLDFLVIAVDAGLSFDIALQRVVQRLHNPLTEGLGLALAEVKLGRGRLEALEDFGRRTEVRDVATFVQMISSSERMGVPIAQALRIQAQDARWRRGERARERAGKAPVRMTIPMVALIFPTIWLVILGPSLISVFTKGL